jgi:hypothetical protein
MDAHERLISQLKAFGYYDHPDIPIRSAMRLTWPRGRYNGLRIDGGSIKVEIHLLWWEWWPNFSWNFGEPYAHWLCLTVRFAAHYGHKEAVPGTPRQRKEA